ncbi:hypothetical protein [Chitinibacter tainanensis]|uniref:hypothetical protein n=1 Tax=Chitinibacter tainanensis TaxID=230667 RepID=UPI000421A6C9|nr:hypothetical protein [Chitinibacter tainanensis]
MKAIQTSTVMTAAALTSILAACGGSSSPSTPLATPVASTKGTVVGSYFKNVIVCEDVNSNLICDANEPKSKTNEKGEFTLPKTRSQLVAEIGPESSRINPETGEEAKIQSKIILRTPPDAPEVISTFSTLIASTMENNSIPFKEAKSKIAKELSISESSLLIDYNKLTDPTEKNKIKSLGNQIIEKIQLALSESKSSEDFKLALKKATSDENLSKFKSAEPQLILAAPTAIETCVAELPRYNKQFSDSAKIKKVIFIERTMALLPNNSWGLPRSEQRTIEYAVSTADTTAEYAGYKNLTRSKTKSLFNPNITTISYEGWLGDGIGWREVGEEQVDETGKRINYYEQFDFTKNSGSLSIGDVQSQSSKFRADFVLEGSGVPAQQKTYYKGTYTLNLPTFGDIKACGAEITSNIGPYTDKSTAKTMRIEHRILELYNPWVINYSTSETRWYEIGNNTPVKGERIIRELVGYEMTDGTKVLP